MRRDTPKFKVSYCKNPIPETLKAERYIKFLKHLVKVVKEQEALSKKARTSIETSHSEFIDYNVDKKIGDK